jgi:hypothetical protein
MKTYLILPIFLEARAVGTATENEIIDAQDALGQVPGVKLVSITTQ